MDFGIHKKIDSLGRIVLPKEIRDTYQLSKVDTVEIVPTENGILIKKPGYKLICIRDDENSVKKSHSKECDFSYPKYGL